MDGTMQAWGDVSTFFVAHKDDIRSWALVVIPALGVVAGWHAGRRKLQLAQEAQETQEQRLIHKENAEQTNAMTSQFRAIMEGYQARVVDLGHEVSILRTEVISLRKALYIQRLICADCPKLPLLLKETLDAAADATAAS